MHLKDGNLLSPGLIEHISFNFCQLPIISHIKSSCYIVCSHKWGYFLPSTGKKTLTALRENECQSHYEAFKQLLKQIRPVHAHRQGRSTEESHRKSCSRLWKRTRNRNPVEACICSHSKCGGHFLVQRTRVPLTGSFHNDWNANDSEHLHWYS